MKYCPMCGSELVERARFCSECGAVICQSSVNSGHKKAAAVHSAAGTDNKPSHTPDSGICPHCGMALSAFSPVCPACGITVERKESPACRNFLDRLDEIDSGLMEPVESTGFESFMSAVSRATGHFSDPISEKEEEKKDKINEMKEDFISTFHVPSNKLDLIEFINLTESLSKSYKNSNDWDLHSIADVLEKKNEETYQRALALMPNDPDLLIIKKKKDAIEEEKLRKEEERRQAYDNMLAVRISRAVSQKIKEFFTGLLKKIFGPLIGEE